MKTGKVCVIILFLLINLLGFFINELIKKEEIKPINNTDVCNYLQGKMIKKDVCRLKINETNGLMNCDNPYLDINF